jgi:parvulin-like peptidyl-prolyl isomerase
MLADYQRVIERYQSQQFLLGDAAAMQAAVLGTLVEQELINQAAASGGVSVTDEEVEAEIVTNIAMAGGEAEWQTWLQDNMYSPEEYRETVRDTLTTLRMRDIITAPLNAEVEQVHGRHILVETEALAAEILTRLQNGEDFAALAAQHSNDFTTRENGGDLGWFTREELLEPTLAELAFTIDPGTVVGPVRTMLGFHILQTLEREVRPIDETKRPALAQVYFDTWLQTLMTSASIEYYLQN